MIYSSDFISNLKKNINLVTLANKYTSMKLKGDGVWQGRCPHPDHNDETPSFVIWERKDSNGYDTWSCMGCHCGKKDSASNAEFKNYGTDAIAFMQWMTDYKGSTEQLTLSKSIEFLAKFAGMSIEQNKYQEKYNELKRLAIKNNERLFKTESLLQYLYGRGLDDQDIQDYMIGYNGHRITFPLPNIDLNIIGFSSRRLDADENSVKYVNSETSDWFHKGSYLYGIHNLNRSLGYAFITEGVFDVILPEKYGVPNVLGTLGTAFTEHNADFIANSNLMPIFCQDNDKAGKLAINKAIRMMADRGVNSKVCLMDTSCDMADMALQLKDKLHEYLLSKAVYFGYYLTDTLFEDYNKQLYDLRMNFLPRALKIIDKIPSIDEGELLKFEIYKKLGGKTISDML